MEFIYDMSLVVGAVLWHIFWGMSRELEVLEAGGEEGRMRPRVKVGHGVEDGEAGRGVFKRKTRVRRKTKNINYKDG